MHVLETPENWAVGQRAEVYIETGRKESAVLLPARFVQWREDRAGVFVDEGRRAVWRPVRLGLRNDQSFEALEGVDEGDRVVVPVKSKHTLADGQRIKVK